MFFLVVCCFSSHALSDNSNRLIGKISELEINTDFIFAHVESSEFTQKVCGDKLKQGEVKVIRLRGSNAVFFHALISSKEKQQVVTFKISKCLNNYFDAYSIVIK